MDRYDTWPEAQLRMECTRRALDYDGHKAQLATRIARDDDNKRGAEPRLAFNKMTDRTGKYEQAQLMSNTKFNKNFWHSIVGSELEFYEAMAKSKKAELEDVLKKEDHNLKAAMKLKDERVASYTGQDNGTGSVNEAVKKPTAAAAKPKNTTESYTVSYLLPVAPPKSTSAIQSPVISKAVVTTPEVPAAKKVYDPMPYVQSAFYDDHEPKVRKPRAKKTALEPKQKTGPKVNDPMPYIESAIHKDSEPKVRKPRAKKAAPMPEKKVEPKKYDPMPHIESTFHKEPEPKIPKFGDRAEKAATEPEPDKEPQPKRFMTAAGADYLKSLNGYRSSNNTSNYDHFVAQPATKRRNEETDASIAKKLRLNPDVIVNPDIHHNKIEKNSVQSDLIGCGYIFLPCEDEKKIRGDVLEHLKYVYRAFAITEVRADTTGYFMAFAKTVMGDRDLKKCFELIDIEIDDKTFFDKNVTDVKISKRENADEEPEPEEELEPQPEMEEVDLGYTHVPYKKPASRRSRGWGR